jgi:glutathione S-transferase
VLTQSLDIVRWALARNDEDGWLVRGDAALDQRLVDATDGDFKHWLDRTKYAERFPAQRAEVYRASAERCLIEPLEASLSVTGYLGGVSPNWADAAIFPFVRQFAAIDATAWKTAPWEATQWWLNQWLDSPAFAACMVKLPVWRAVAPGPRWPT